MMSKGPIYCSCVRGALCQLCPPLYTHVNISSSIRPPIAVRASYYKFRNSLSDKCTTSIEKTLVKQLIHFLYLQGCTCCPPCCSVHPATIGTQTCLLGKTAHPSDAEKGVSSLDTNSILSSPHQSQILLQILKNTPMAAHMHFPFHREGEQCAIWDQGQVNANEEELDNWPCRKVALSWFIGVMKRLAASRNSQTLQNSELGPHSLTGEWKLH